MADVPCLDHSLDGYYGSPDDAQTTNARATNARMVEMHANPFWHACEPVWRLERLFLNRGMCSLCTNRRTEHGERPTYQIKHF